MTTRHDYRLSRRLFLTDFGKGTLAIAVLGTGLVACSSDSSNATADSTDGADADTGPATTETGAAATTSEDAGSAAEQLQWQRADYGLVSAYVLARGNEVAIVDTGTGNSTRLEEALAALSLGWADVNHVIVTHAHGDHIGGLVEVLTAAPGATGYAGAGDIENIRAPRDLVSVSDGDEIFGLNVIGTPGHTPGHISVLDPQSGLFVAGDAMVTSDGRLGGPVAEFSDDIGLAQDSVKMLVDRSITTILVGHGDPITDGAGQQLNDLAASL